MSPRICCLLLFLEISIGGATAPGHNFKQETACDPPCPCAITGEHFFVVMRKYGGNLRQWRLALPADPALQLRLYLNIFADVARAVQVRRSTTPETVSYLCQKQCFLQSASQ